MRCLLVLPDDPQAVDAALRSGAEAVVFDLGDADAAGDRAARRRAAFDALKRLQNAPPSRLAGEGAPTTSGRMTGLSRRAEKPPFSIVRLAPLSSGLVDADLDGVVPGAPDAVLLPAAVGGADLQHLAAKLAVAEAEHGRDAGRTGIVAAPAETGAGVLALGSLPGATPRLRALSWDPVPLARALGTGPDASPVRTARDLLVLAASACGVPVLALDAAPAR